MSYFSFILTYFDARFVVWGLFIPALEAAYEQGTY